MNKNDDLPQHCRGVVISVPIDLYPLYLEVNGLKPTGFDETKDCVFVEKKGETDDGVRD